MQSLKEFREEGARLYQRKNIAAALGITGPTYDAIERNQSKRMNPDMAERLGRYFGVDGDIFLTKGSN